MFNKQLAYVLSREGLAANLQPYGYTEAFEQIIEPATFFIPDLSQWILTELDVDGKWFCGHEPYTEEFWTTFKTVCEQKWQEILMTATSDEAFDINGVTLFKDCVK
jgi:lipocalin